LPANPKFVVLSLRTNENALFIYFFAEVNSLKVPLVYSFMSSELPSKNGDWVDSSFEFFHRLGVGNVTNVSDKHDGSIFRVEVSEVCESSSIYTTYVRVPTEQLWWGEKPHFCWIFWNKHEDSQIPITSFLKMEAACTSETSATLPMSMYPPQKKESTLV
jgi:hypothetical protein